MIQPGIIIFEKLVAYSQTRILCIQTAMLPGQHMHLSWLKKEKFGVQADEWLNPLIGLSTVCVKDKYWVSLGLNFVQS